jgi:peptide/nickel transport system substrate-binding protein
MKWASGQIPLLAASLALAIVTGPSGARAQVEPPALVEAVRKGTLPPMAERLPKTPHITHTDEHGREPGQPGGEIRMLMSDQRDLRMMTLYGYTRLVHFNTRQELKPDLLQDVQVEDGRRFTLLLREGHRWSDGAPFTTEDFRYWWEDVANNKRLSPEGPPLAMYAGGKLPEVEILDQRRIRFTWSVPNPSFLPALAAPQPMYLYQPAHYLRQFHNRYADPVQLKQAIKHHHVRDWGALHLRKARAYRQENPDLPTLEPWQNRTHPPAERFVFERNPYFHRVDQRGQQLPYLDRIVVNIVTASLIPTKVGAGDSDLQARYLSFDNFTFLKSAAKRQNYSVKLWRNASGSYLALYPNLNAKDPVWRAILRDVRVRRAFSLALNRKDINNVLFFGLGTESANTLIEGSPLFKPAYRDAWAQHDPKLANKLLDEAGLDKRDFDGTRLLPDGRRAVITLEGAGDKAEETDSIELIVDNFRAIGIRLFYRPAQLVNLRRRVLIGEAILSLWQGLDNGLAGPDMEPSALAPANPEQFEWPRFGQYVKSGETFGDPVDMPEVKELSDLLAAWRRSSTTEERRQIWNRMLAIHAENVFSIGIVNGSLQPVVAIDRLHNVPDSGWYSVQPGGYLGVYRPDLFWLSKPVDGN